MLARGLRSGHLRPPVGSTGCCAPPPPPSAAAPTPLLSKSILHSLCVPIKIILISHLLGIESDPSLTERKVQSHASKPCVMGSRWALGPQLETLISCLWNVGSLGGSEHIRCHAASLNSLGRGRPWAPWVAALHAQVPAGHIPQDTFPRTRPPGYVSPAVLLLPRHYLVYAGRAAAHDHGGVRRFLLGCEKLAFVSPS